MKWAAPGAGLNSKLICFTFYLIVDVLFVPARIMPDKWYSGIKIVISNILLSLNEIISLFKGIL